MHFLIYLFFTGGFVFPPLKSKMAAFQNYLHETLLKVTKGLNVTVQQYNDTCVSENNLNYLS